MPDSASRVRISLRIPGNSSGWVCMLANTQRLAASAWHTYEIKVTDRTYEVLLNGKPATMFTADPADPSE